MPVFPEGFDMACLDLQYSSSRGGVAAVVEDTSKFTKLEDRVTALAHHDPVSSVRAARKLGQVVNAVFGVKTPNHLADPRLEALRRYVVLSGSRSGMNGRDQEDFLIGGYSRGQRDELDRRLGNDVSAIDARSPITSVMGWLGDRATETWVRSRVSDSFIAAMIIAYLGLPLAVSPNPWR